MRRWQTGLVPEPQRPLGTDLLHCSAEPPAQQRQSWNGGVGRGAYLHSSAREAAEALGRTRPGDMAQIHRNNKERASALLPLQRSGGGAGRNSPVSFRPRGDTLTAPGARTHILPRWEPGVCARACACVQVCVCAASFSIPPLGLGHAGIEQGDDGCGVLFVNSWRTGFYVGKADLIGSKPGFFLFFFEGQMFNEAFLKGFRTVGQL